MKRTLKLCFAFLIVLAGGCANATRTPSSAANISGINHIVKQSVNWFTVNGYGGTLKGNTCCIMLPDKWRPGLKARIEWEVDPDAYGILPPLGTEEYRKAYAEHAAKYQHYSAVVDIPQYDQACDLTVHFLPCKQIKVTTSCYGYGGENYPIKEPLNMKEPATCPVNQGAD
ncbi:DUF3304 domain-containing protein [Salmonella enterica]|nr:DUF3304 domain-containing protein [Salmonella enterica]EAX8457729.1 DUF3304 domain-containing protein [Salmonella enterica]EAX8555916.1 DUF3304 domain-containing protein [Salmonella enterica]EAX8596214.1 DUF3304 domain-containing protein [Salmonella enterica]EAX8618198.1 DUF3304 domain-containing protein [Salmonella enterica]